MFEKDTVISGRQKKLYEGNALLAARANDVDKEELFEAIDRIGKSSLEPIAASHNSFQKFVRFVQRAISFRITVKPLVQKSIRQMIAKESDVEKLKELYKDPQALSGMVQNAILASSAAHSFSGNEIRHFIQNELVQAIQTRLKELKQPLWDKGTINQLNVQRIVNHLATHPNESNPQLFKELQGTPVLDLPINELDQIPITSQNRDHLAQTWKHFIETTFKEGKLNKLATESEISEGITQTRYASVYSELNHYLPDQLKSTVVDMSGDTLQGYCDQLEARQPIKKLHDFVIQRSNVPIDSAILGEAGIFYKKFIAPVFNKMKLNALPLSLVGNSLALKDLTLINQFIAKVREKEKKSKLGMASFDDQWLKAVLHSQLEKVAVTTHHLLTPQLAMLRKLHKDSEKQEVQVGQIRAGIDKYKAEEVFIAEAEQFLTLKQELSEVSLHLKIKEDRLKTLWSGAGKGGPKRIKANQNETELLTIETLELEMQKGNLEEELKKLARSPSESPWLSKLRNRKDIDVVDFEREIENHQKFVKDQFKEGVRQLFKNPLSIGALKMLTIHAKGSELNTIAIVWKHVLTQEFEKVDLNHLSPHTRIENLKEQFKGFILAKAHFKSFMQNPVNKSSFWHQGISRRTSSIIEELEKRIEQPSVKKYLHQAATSAILDINEALFGDEVIKAVVTEKSHHSTFTAAQQANLMHLNKVFHKAQKNQLLTLEDQMEVTKTLELLRTDKKLPALIRELEYEESISPIFLDYLPKFMHGFIKRHILKDVANKEHPKLLGGIDAETIEFLRDYLARAKNIKELQVVDQLNTKAGALLVKMQDPALAKTIPKEERLNLRELGILSRSERLNDDGLVKNLQALGVLEFDPDLKKWVDNHKKSEEIFANLTKNILTPALDEYYKDGCILAESTKRKEAWSGRPASSEERAIAWVANGFTHGAKLFHDEAGHIMLSHVTGEYDQDPVNLFDLATLEIWEMDVAPLVDSSLHVELENVYGKEWKSHINKMYQDIEKNLHQSGMEKFKGVENSEERRIKAGLANRPWLYRLFGLVGLKGHKAASKRKLSKIHQNFIQEKPLKEEQICSEFVSKATLASMLELNLKMTQDIRNHHKISKRKLLDQISNAGIPLEKDVKEYINGKRYYKKEAVRTEKAEQGLRNVLKSLGKSKKEIELIIRLGNRDFLDLPYKNERMRTIHPGRMVNILTNKKCAKPLPPPPKLAQFINFDPAAAKSVKK